MLIEGEAASADTFYYLLQELDTVTGLIEKNGALAEADVYDGYGKVKIWDYSAGDFDRDGDVDATDQTTFNAALLAGGANKSTPDPMSDFDGDGDTDLTDAAAFTVIKNAGGNVANRYVSSIGNPFFFTGRRLYMLETLPEGASVIQANQQLQHNRARHYSPLEGRWLQRDPLWYPDSANLYHYVHQKPTVRFDLSGLVDLQITEFGLRLTELDAKVYGDCKKDNSHSLSMEFSYSVKYSYQGVWDWITRKATTHDAHVDARAKAHIQWRCKAGWLFVPFCRNIELGRSFSSSQHEDGPQNVRACIGGTILAPTNAGGGCKQYQVKVAGAFSRGLIPCQVFVGDANTGEIPTPIGPIGPFVGGIVHATGEGVQSRSFTITTCCNTCGFLGCGGCTGHFDAPVSVGQ